MLTQMAIYFRKDVDPEEKIEFKTRLGESPMLPFGLLLEPPLTYHCPSFL